jgi:hypothetical protein
MIKNIHQRSNTHQFCMYFNTNCSMVKFSCFLLLGTAYFLLLLLLTIYNSIEICRSFLSFVFFLSVVFLPSEANVTCGAENFVVDGVFFLFFSTKIKKKCFFILHFIFFVYLLQLHQHGNE